MRFLIASDIHGSSYWCGKLIERFHSLGADKLILLGDLLYHGPRNELPRDYAPKKVIETLNPLADRIICVRGNCDSEVDQMVLEFPIMSESAVIHAFGQTAFAAHGHNYSPDKLPPLSDGDIFLYGHIHVQKDIVVSSNEKNIRCINPGSVSIPKDNSYNGCILWENGAFTNIPLAD